MHNDLFIMSTIAGQPRGKELDLYIGTSPNIGALLTIMGKDVKEVYYEPTRGFGDEGDPLAAYLLIDQEGVGYRGYDLKVLRVNGGFFDGVNPEWTTEYGIFQEAHYKAKFESEHRVKRVKQGDIIPQYKAATERWAIREIK